MMVLHMANEFREKGRPPLPSREWKSAFQSVFCAYSVTPVLKMARSWNPFFSEQTCSPEATRST